ncbi:MAG: hypothetical protein JXA57_03035 [Armatimonadetes bacterium]|nr:hypothetical protein [Armatimonadota bacterium]
MPAVPVEIHADALAIVREGARHFKAFGEDRYRLALPKLGVMFEVDGLRYERHDLIGELSVRCDLPGVRTVDGTLTMANLNLSSVRARNEHGRYCASRASTNCTIDWFGLVEEFCQRVLHAHQTGQPAVDLRELPRPEGDDMIHVEGLAFPRRHPTVIFGDGGAAKSHLGLYLAGRLAEQGMSVALFDWELAGEDHRVRLERLFADGMPRIIYARCARPLVHEADRLRRIVREHEIEYAVYDSVAFASDGPPEAAEVAGRYFQTIRKIGPGSLHVAHTNKSDDSDKKPFGSTFWHNGARSTWFAKKAEASPDTGQITLGLFNRKSNLGQLQAPVGYIIEFANDRTIFLLTEVADCPDFAVNLSIRQRMAYLLRRVPMTPDEIAEELDAKPDSVRRTLRRHKRLFTVIEGGRYALAERRSV